MKTAQSFSTGNAGLPSLFAVAFFSSALTMAIAGLIFLAVSFGFTGGIAPILNFVKTAAQVVDPKISKPENGNLTQVEQLDTHYAMIGKSSVSSSVVFKSEEMVVTEASAETVVTDNVMESKDAEPEANSIEVDFEEPVVGFEQPANLPEGIPAMLRRKRNGIEIGNFRSVTMEGAADECLNLGYSMLSAAKANQDLLDVMVTNKQITIANICASNGKVVFSCRNGRISISPRRARPDDSCSRA